VEGICGQRDGVGDLAYDELDQEEGEGHREHGADAEGVGAGEAAEEFGWG